MTTGKGRFEAFSDGVFAIAITLLVLEFSTAAIKADNDRQLAAVLLAMWPQYLVYVASFGTIGIMWLNHHALFRDVQTITHPMHVFNLLLLMLIAFLPFPTALLGRFGLTTTGSVFYGIVIIGTAVCYNLLYYEVHVAPRKGWSLIDFLVTRNLWNSIGPIVYLIAIPLAYVSPLASIVAYAGVAVFYLFSAGTAARPADVASR